MTTGRGEHMSGAGMAALSARLSRGIGNPFPLSMGRVIAVGRHSAAGQLGAGQEANKWPSGWAGRSDSGADTSQLLGERTC